MERVFEFDDKVSMKEAAEDLFLATIIAEMLHGRDVMLVEAKFKLKKSERNCTVDVSTKAGRTIAIVFAGLLSRVYGEKAWKVKA